jgi:CrcB protein
MTPIYVSLAGSVGAITRFLVDSRIRAKYNQVFPWATLTINISGSLILGIAVGILLKHKGFTTIEAIIGAGFCGGYTTFSTASFETVRLLERKQYGAAISYAAGGLALASIAATIGLLIGQLL